MARRLKDEQPPKLGGGVGGRLLPAGREGPPDAGDAIVIRPPAESVRLPPGLAEESFDLDAPGGRVSMLQILLDVVFSINTTHREKANLVFVLSGPVTYWYGPGGGIPWAEVKELRIHPLNMENVGFREGRGSVGLNEPLRRVLIGTLAKYGLTIGVVQSSVLVRELSDVRITLYTPTEIGYSRTLWHVLDPHTSIYVGPPENQKIVQEKIESLPDRRTILADECMKDARNYAAGGNLRDACISLAGACQVLGKIGLRLSIYQAYRGNRIDEKTFGQFLEEAENAKERIDALWRYRDGDLLGGPGMLNINPVEITLTDEELGGFIELFRSLSIVCIVSRSGETVTITLDWNELGNRICEIGIDHILQFREYFEEVTDPVMIEARRSNLIRVKRREGTTAYYDLKEITEDHPDRE